MVGGRGGDGDDSGGTGGGNAAIQERELVSVPIFYFISFASVFNSVVSPFGSFILLFTDY